MSKYSSVKTVVDGISFDSKAEARRYGELKLAELAGEIDDLQLQPEFLLLVSTGASVGKYRADFRYYDHAQQAWIVEDVKGMKTPVYKLKKRIVEAVYGIKILETA